MSGHLGTHTGRGVRSGIVPVDLYLHQKDSLFLSGGALSGIVPDDSLKRAAEMLLNGATLLAQPCPYCAGVRVMKDGRALCASCGSEPRDPEPEPAADDLERHILDLTRQLGVTKNPAERQNILDSISELSDRLAGLRESD